MKAKAGAKAKPGAIGTKPVKVRKGGGKGAVLSGGNPRIAKGDGDAPVQAYIAGMPGWKRDIVKVAFFRGTSLRPVPPGASKVKDTRYIDIHEGDELDDALMTTWVKQAAALPGWRS